eukprot:Pgem_evm1s4144
MTSSDNDSGYFRLDEKFNSELLSTKMAVSKAVEEVKIKYRDIYVNNPIRQQPD